MATLKELEMQMKGMEIPRVKYPKKLKNFSTMLRVFCILDLIIGAICAFFINGYLGFVIGFSAFLFYMAAEAVSEHADNQYKIMSDLDKLLNSKEEQ